MLYDLKKKLYPYMCAMDYKFSIHMKKLMGKCWLVWKSSTLFSIIQIICFLPSIILNFCLGVKTSNIFQIELQTKQGPIVKTYFPSTMSVSSCNGYALHG